MQFVIVTGLSGAGKSQAINCLEDLGYFCIDNLPPALIKDFIQLRIQDKVKISKAAFVVDIRGGEFFDDLVESLSDLNKAGMDYKILFLEASDQVLLRRYKETRRTHPLSEFGLIQEGIEAERERLSDIRKQADYIVDTSDMKASRLNEEIRRLFLSDEGAAAFNITIKSFGYKNGIPLDADMVIDMRFLPNPFYLSSLKKLTGNNRKVKDYVIGKPEAKDFVDKMHSLICDLIPLYMREGKPNLVLAFGCTGGQHRSVAMANIFTDLFQKEGIRVLTIHRDL